MIMALYLSGLPLQNLQPPSDLEKTINRKIAVEDQSMKYLASTLQNCQSHQKQGKPEARDPGTKCRTTCLLSKLILGDLEHLWPFLSRQPPLRDRPCSYQHGPFRPWPWTCDILDSFCSQLWLNVTHLFRCLSGKKSR